jgi:hypothetical protein
MVDESSPRLSDLTDDERARIDDGFAAIRDVLARRNINIRNVIGLVTEDEVREAGQQVEIRFAESVARMNMVAFD